jgi:thiol-disulfide isomerase/thioredoxin
MKVTHFLSFAIVALAANTFASAQELGVGSKAPALSVEEWIQGEAVPALQPGHVYVVEFWATWCPPCRTSIPHINELSNKYKEKITVLGIAGSERYKELDAGRTVLADFVKGQADKMTYRVAFDTDRSMSKDWMAPAGQGGIPTAFIVDGTGTIAWIGHPMSMDKPLESIVAGKWDLKAEAKKAKEEKILGEKANALLKVAGPAMQASDYAAAIAACDKAFAEEPKLEEKLGSMKFQALIKKKDYTGVTAYGTKLLGGAFKDNAQGLNAIAWMIVDPEDATIEQRDYKLAIAAGTRACELEPKNAGILDTLATAHFGNGEIAKAVELQTKAVELAKGTDMEKDLAERLETFKKASVKGKN